MHGARTPHTTQVKLETWQEEEAKQVRDKLGQELELLIAFQSKQRMQSEQQMEAERKQLDEKVSLRCAVLEQKVPSQLFSFPVPIQPAYTIWLIRL